MKKSSNTRATIPERPFSTSPNEKKSKSYLSIQNRSPQKLRKTVSDVRTEKLRCSQRLKSNAEGRVRELGSSLPEKNRFISYSLRKRIDSKKSLHASKLSDFQTKDVKTNPEYKPLFHSPRAQAIKRKVQSENSTITKKEQPFSCSTCKKLFKRKEHLRRHFSTHTGDKPFSCSTCKMLFHRKDHLKRHLTIHTEDKPFSCGTCKKSFRMKDHLTRHFSIHTEEKPFSCGTCKKMFKRKDHLKKHFRVHKKDKSFSRVIYKKRLILKSHPKKPLRVHLSDKLFACHKCSKTFKHKNHLKLHNRIHLKKNSFSCKKCQKTFKQEIYLQRHLITHSRKNVFAGNKHKNIFQFKVGVKRRLEGKNKPFDHKVCKQVFKGTEEIKDFSGVCTRSKSLSRENCGIDFDHKYEVLSTDCTDTKSSSYDCSAPGKIQEDNRQLEERHPIDLKENSLEGNTHLKRKIDDRIMMRINTEKSQDCCDKEKNNTRHIKLNRMKRQKIPQYEVLSTDCTDTKSSSYDCSAPGKIQEDNRQLEERHPIDLKENSLEGNTHLKRKIDDRIMMHINTEKSQDCCDKEKNNTRHIKLNRMKRQNNSAYSEICTRFKSLSIKTCEKELDHISELSIISCTDSRSNSLDWSAPCTIWEGNSQLEEKVCNDFPENSLKDNTHLKQKVENWLMMHINTDKENSQDCCDNEKNNSSQIELNQIKRTNISAYSVDCTRNKSLFSENSTDFTVSKNNSWDCSSLDIIQKDNRSSEETNCTDFAENFVTDSTNLTQTVENQLKVHLNTDRENSVDCCDNETKSPNHTGLNQMKERNVSAYSVICTRSKLMSSKKCEKGIDHKDELISTGCIDYKNNSYDSLFPGTILKDNRQSEEKRCTDLAENSVTGNTHLTQTIENELMIHLNKETENSQDCCDNENNPNHIEINQMKETNISECSVICTRSKSFSSKLGEKGFDHKDELASTTCTTASKTDSFSSGLSEIRKDIRQLEENISSYLAENSLIDNIHLEPVIQNELMIHINAEKESS